jgi:CheY-like chemotaxis protein
VEATSGTHVLVVDDDADLRALLRALLEDEGYVVSEARNGRKALELLIEQNEPVVVLADDGMPQMTGSELLAAIERTHCALGLCACVLLTGSAEDLLPPAGVPVIGKPFDLDELLAVVAAAARALERQPARCATC